MLTPEPEGQLKKRHKYLLRENSELNTIHISKTQKENVKNIKKIQKQIQVAEDKAKLLSKGVPRKTDQLARRNQNNNFVSFSVCWTKRTLLQKILEMRG
jgi:hypothetical protein